MRTSGVKKEKLPIKNDEKSSLVAEEGLFHDPFLGCLTPKNPSDRRMAVGTGFIIFNPSLKQAWLGLKIIKP